MIVRVDKKVYSDVCISKSIYALADRYIIQRNDEGRHEQLDIQPFEGFKCNEKKMYADLFSTLNDFKLRCIIEEETKDIRTIIYAKAFADDNENC